METLEIIQILEKKDFAHDEAIRLAEAINGKSGLATKEDIAKLNAKIDTQFAELKTTQRWIVTILISINIPIFLLIIGMAVKMFLE